MKAILNDKWLIARCFLRQFADKKVQARAKEEFDAMSIGKFVAIMN